jgi:predicted permease
MIDAVLFRAVPVKDPKELVLLKWDIKRSPPGVMLSGYDPGDKAFSYPTLARMRSQEIGMSSIFGFAPLGQNPENVTVSIDGQTSSANGEMVTGNYFLGLGLSPVWGRLINEQDEKKDAPHVAVLSEGYWTRVFGRDQSINNKTVKLNGFAYSIVGIAPLGFAGLDPRMSADLWIPIIQERGLTPWGVRPSGLSLYDSGNWWWMTIMGRLKRGFTEQRVTAALNQVFQQSVHADVMPLPEPKDMPTLSLIAGSGGVDNLRQQFSKPLLALMALVVLLLLIACVNVATMFLGKAVARRREVAVRLSLGASRMNLVAQLFGECIPLSAMGGLGGIFLAFLCIRVPILLKTVRVPLHMDLPVLAFGMTVAMSTAFLFGLVPALWSARTNIATVTKEGTAFEGGQKLRLRLANTLIAGQVALSLLLLTTAGLFLRTISNLEKQNIGFNPHGILLFRLNPIHAGYRGQEIVTLYHRLLQNLQAIPSVSAASFSGISLISNNRNAGPVSILNYTPGLDQSRIVNWNDVGPGFFKTTEITVLQGRGIEWQDMALKPKVAVINTAFARYFFKQTNPLGQRFTLNRPPSLEDSFEVIGVVQDAKYENLWQEVPRTVYVPYTQTSFPLHGMFFEVRSAANPVSLVPEVRAALHSVAPDIAPTNIKAQDEQIAETVAQQSLLACLASFFGIVAMVLMAMGFFGLLSYSVTRRTREIGIRMALGARRKTITAMILRQSLTVVIIGVAIGIPCALSANRLLVSLLYGVKASDPITAVLAVLTMTGVAVIAGYLPAARAARIDPNKALRYE